VASLAGWECVVCTKPSAEVLADTNQTQGQGSLCASCVAGSVVGNYQSAALEQLFHGICCTFTISCFDDVKLVKQQWFFLACPGCTKCSQRWTYVLPVFFIYRGIYFLTIFVRPIISTSTGPIFTKFAGLVEL